MNELVPLPWHEEAQRMLESEPILLLEGPPGSGKSAWARSVTRRATGHDPVELPSTPETRKADMIGSKDLANGNTEFAPGYLTQAVRDHRWFLLEDINHVPKLVASYLLPIREGRPLSLPKGETLPIPEGFRVILTANRFDFGCSQHTTDLEALVDGTGVLRVERMPTAQIEALLRRKHPEAASDDITWVMEMLEELGTMRSNNEKQMSLGFRSTDQALRLLASGFSRNRVLQIAFVNKFILDKDLFEAAELKASVLAE